VRRGFTLVELVVAMSVGVIISGVAAAMVWDASKQRSEASARAELADEAAAALEQMVRYVREIPQDECPGNPTPCLLGNAQVGTASQTELTFGNTGFRLSGDALQMTLDGGTNWHLLAADVSDFALTYYDRSASALAAFPLSPGDREDIRRVHVALTLERANQATTVRTGVYLRRFMDEVQTDP
jgi:prepilin-type N-terminal cleavage/methylation domain-containing protein